MTVLVPLSGMSAAALPGSAPDAARGLTSQLLDFAALLADGLQPPAALPPPPPMPAAMPPPQFYPWVAMPFVVPAAREDRGGKKKRPPPRWDHRPDGAPTLPGRARS